MKIKRLSFFLALIIVIGSIFSTTQVNAAAPKQLSSEIIAPGAERFEYEWKVGYGNLFVSVVKCDLTNPMLKIGMVMGNGTYTQKATVSQMANRTGAVALVNGDFFNMKAQGAPLGASITDGRMASAPMNSIGYHALGIDKSKTAFIEQITFGGYVIASNGKKYPIQGLNKAAYEDNITGAHSHDNTINLYNDLWTAKSRGAVTAKSIELLVNKNGVVEDISQGSTLKYAVPKDKIILQANDKAKNFIVENIKKGDKIKLDYKIRPERDWEVMIGGHGLLVDNAKVIPYALAPQSIDGQRARTAVGISQNGKTLWIAAIEGQTSRSKGAKLKDLAQFMQQLGCFKAVNLDGGGSTAMSAKHTGELKPELVVNPERNGSERYVVNGLGVYNTAQEGPLTNIKIKGPNTMLLGETANFKVLGWDDNYVAKNMEGVETSFTDTVNGNENWFGTNKLASSIGEMTINATAGNLSASKAVNVVGSSGVDYLQLTVSESKPQAGSSGDFKLVAVTKTGRKVEINPRIAKIYLEEYEGAVVPEENKFEITTIGDKFKGYLVADYDGIVAKTAFINPDYRQISMTIGKKAYKVGDEKKNMDTSPIISNNRTMVPLRFLVESFGGVVNWHEETREAEVIYKNNIITIALGSDSILVNGSPIKIDSPAMVKDDRTLIPIRFISENLGMIVEYDAKTKGVNIFEKMTGNESIAIASENTEKKEATINAENTQEGINLIEGENTENPSTEPTKN